MDTFLQFLLNFGMILACLVVGYFFGCIQTSIIVGKVFYKQDPRDFGSHNGGATNSGRLWGKKVGFLIAICDMLKTIIPIWIMWSIFRFAGFQFNGLDIYNEPIRNALGGFTGWQGGLQFYFFTSIGCLLGHCYPVFYRFRGGKGFSNYMGLIFGISWFVGLIVGSLFFLILWLKRYVSLSSICCAIIGTIFSWFTIFPIFNSFIFYGPETMVGGLEFALTMTIISILTIYRHKANIGRLINGTERRIKWMDSKKEKEARRLAEAAASENNDSITEVNN